jgi:hypothetical protein
MYAVTLPTNEYYIMIPRGVWCNGGVSTLLFNRRRTEALRVQLPAWAYDASAGSRADKHHPYPQTDVGKPRTSFLYLRLRHVRATRVTELLREN